MMTIDTLHKIAIYHFNHIRTKCKFIKIHHYIEKDESCIFYGLFQCKRRVIVKKIEISYEGTVFSIKHI